MPGAAPAICGSPPFNGRLFAAVADAAGRAPRSRRSTRSAGRCCRWRTRPAADRGGPRADRVRRSRRRAARRGVRSAARLRAARRRGSAAAPGVTLQRGSGAAKGHRNVLHAPAARPLSGPARRSRRSSTRPRRSASSSCKCRPGHGQRRVSGRRVRYLADAYETALVRAGGCHPSDLGPPERAAIRRHDRRAVPVRRRPEPDGRAARAAVAVAATLAADRPLTLSRSSSAGRRQPAGRVAREPSPRRRPGAGASAQPTRCRCSTTPALGDALRQALPARFALATTPDDTARTRAREGAAAGGAERARWRA